MILGIGCTIGAFLSATFSDRFSVLSISKFGMLILVVCTVLTYINNSYEF
jgi:predicted MFS family arabinose efflux permease